MRKKHPLKWVREKSGRTFFPSLICCFLSGSTHFQLARSSSPWPRTPTRIWGNWCQHTCWVLAKFSLADQKWIRFPPGSCCFFALLCFVVFSVFLMGLKRAREDAKLTGMGRDSARSHLSRGKKGSWVSCSLKRLGSLRAGWGGVVHLTKSLYGLLAICFYCSPVWAVPKQSSAASSSLWNQTLDSPQHTMKYLPKPPLPPTMQTLFLRPVMLGEAHCEGKYSLSFPPFLFYQ